ncbi:hypothetical protein A2853_01950 [Candidatus Kaiserbacteria bacterium RIFCSPHIGHO2_01_FULL_55_17]|uniref:Uncharacterized protein n=1 Tax=Candidatus Kaiserbacteria bacterium RIFCSPHIGHO2_01_FULL_55_17 TaxID=1798484 RepID=A0A1F6D8D4_9BACT|nr:MAG: hypothetical protein A2853_01950 [Candidatus Kaiserbacteria bacterium RIFCSPHIGHO2_01_FULL_55_17]
MSFEGGNNTENKGEIERIKTAAIKYKEEIFEGRTHYEAWLLMSAKYPETVAPSADEREDGYITTNDRFVSRKEALEIAEAADQIKKERGHSGHDLASEDLKKNEE